jgi:rod shape-determining protein MreC
MRTVSDRGRAGLSAFVLFCISLSLTSYSVKHTGTSGYANQIVAESIRPFSSASYAVYDWSRQHWEGYINLVGLKEENEHIISRLKILESQNAKLGELEQENRRLKSLLLVKDIAQSHTVAARVIGYDPSGWIQAITINRGLNDGVNEGDAVIDGAGIVGQVITVSHNTSRVLLVIDRTSGVDAFIQDNRGRGIVEGSGSSTLEFKFVTDSEEIKIGEKIVTSGLDGVFPKGLIVGIVSQSGTSSGGMFKVIKINPAVNFQKLEDVLVLIHGGQ